MTLQRIHKPSRQRFESEFVATNTPVIITGMMEGWSSVSKWSLDYLNSVVGSRPLPIRYYPSGYAGPHREIELEFRDYAERMRRNPHSVEKYYLGEVSVRNRLPELAGDIQDPGLFDREQLNNDGLFVGVDSISPAHYHSLEEAILAQIHGRKQFVLFSPDQLGLLQPQPWFAPMSNVSQLDLADPEVWKQDTLRRARPIEVTVEAGEMIFIPIHWWHFVRGYDLSMSLTFFWWSHWRRMVTWPTARTLTRYVVSLRVQRRLWELQKFFQQGGSPRP